MCDHWRELGCPEGDGTPNGATCEAVCDNVQDSGIITWDLECMATVVDCDGIEGCQ